MNAKWFQELCKCHFFIVMQSLLNSKFEACYNDDDHHRLRGSASPVLTATGFVNGKGQSPTESTPLNRSPKYLSQVITSATPTVVPN